ncbi:MAG: helix-turn-helix domain-containing protein [Pedobacter sp.]|nr:MAG: helix-turn-helix domain-containing protein [Pedobacter sp.]
MKEKEMLPVHVLPDTPFLVSEEKVAFGQHFLHHRIHFYAIIWFTEDQDIHYIDFEPYPIKKNTIYLLAKNQVHAIPSQSLPNARVIVFSNEFFHSITETAINQLFLPFENKGIAVPPDKLTELNHLFLLLQAEFQGQSDMKFLKIYTKAFLLILHRFTNALPLSFSHKDERIIRLLQLIESNFKTQQTVTFYAAQVGLSPKRMNEILKESLGFTLNQLCNQLLLLESKRSLQEPGQSIKQIAYQLGFSDQSYFSRYFRKHANMSPEQFRASTIQSTSF